MTGTELAMALSRLLLAHGDARVMVSTECCGCWGEATDVRFVEKIEDERGPFVVLHRGETPAPEERNPE